MLDDDITLKPKVYVNRVGHPQSPDARNQPEQETLKYLRRVLSDMQAVIYTGPENLKVRDALAVVERMIQGYIK